MFRPPEYAAFINPAINIFATLSLDAARSWDQIIQAAREAAMSPEGYTSSIESCIAEIQRLGPKEWSPIGEYKL